MSRVTEQLGDVLRGQVVFIGASLLPLMETEENVLSASRANYDVDAVTATSSGGKKFATLEFELVTMHDWPTRAEARRASLPYIETWYNRRRRNSTLGDVSPAAYEAQLPKAASFLSRTRPLFRGKSSRVAFLPR